MAAASDEGYVAWDLFTHERLPSPSATDLGNIVPGRKISFADDDKSVLLPWTFHQPQAQLWNTETGAIESVARASLEESRPRFIGPNREFIVGYRPDASPAAEIRSARDDSGATLAVYEMETGSLRPLPEVSGVFAWRPSEQADAVLAARLQSNRTQIGVWNLTSGETIGFLEGHADDVYAIAYSHDGTRIATGGRDSLRVWDASTLDEVVQLYGHTSFVWSVAFRPDGAQLASGSGDQSVRIWDTEPFRRCAQARTTTHEAIARLSKTLVSKLADAEDARLVAIEFLSSQEMPTSERTAALRFLMSQP